MRWQELEDAYKVKIIPSQMLGYKESHGDNLSLGHENEPSPLHFL